MGSSEIIVCVFRAKHTISNRGHDMSIIFFNIEMPPRTTNTTKALNKVQMGNNFISNKLENTTLKLKTLSPHFSSLEFISKFNW